MASLFKFRFAGKSAPAKPLLRNAKAVEISVSHAGADFKVLVKKSATAKRYILRLRAATQDLVLSMPARGSILRATEFAQKQSAWIAERVGKLPVNIPFKEEQSVPLRGTLHIIKRREKARGTTRSINSNGICSIEVCCEEGHLSRRVTEFLHREARKDLSLAVGRYTEIVKVPLPRVSLKDTKSRWGSCSSRGSLNFSWRLIMAPSNVLDYLAAHEVAHLKHMDHSREFWSLTRLLDPEMDVAEEWLKTHGHNLHRYGKSP